MLAAPLLEAAGVKSWGSFLRGTSLYHVEREPGGVHIVPTVSDGGGFSRRASGATSVAVDSTPEELGDLLLRAIAGDESRSA